MLNKVKQSLHKHFLPPDLHKDLNAPEGVVRPKVWLDVVRGEDSNDTKRIEIELFSDIVPKTAENFRQLCTGECGRSYERATFHRVVPSFMVQGGDIINGDGTGIWSIYGGPFADEGFSIPHSAKGLVSMANQGPNTNGCQFFITLGEAEFLNGKHVVFGRVTNGWDVVKKIEAVPLAGERPAEVVGIVACGGDGPAPGQQVAGASDNTLTSGQQHAGAGAAGAAGAGAAAGGAAGAAGLAGHHAAQQQQGAALPTEHGQQQHALPQQNVNQPQHALPQEHVNQPQHALPQEHATQPQHALPPGQQQVPQQGVQQGVAGGVAGQGVQPGVQQGVPQQGIQQPGVQQPGVQQQGYAPQGVGQQVPGQQGIAQQGVGQQIPGQQGIAQQQQIPGQQGIAQQGVPQQGIAQQGIPQQGIQQGVPQHGLQQNQQQYQGQGVSAQQLAPEQGGQSAPLADRFPDPPQAQPAQSAQGQY